MSYKAKPIVLLSALNSTSEIKEAITNFYKDWIERHSLKDGDLLYHYTTLTGLIGIIETRSIWCSHISTLNDPNENYYGQELVLDKLNQAISSETDLLIKQFLKEVVSNVKYYNENFYHTYVACFCEKDNILSQWRGYANKGGGYLLEFNFDSSTKFSHDEFNLANESALSIRHIIYDIELQNKIIDECLSGIIRGAKKAIQKYNKKLPITWLAQSGMEAANIFFDIIWSFKNPAFEEEKDWRLIKTRAANKYPELLKFREDSSGLIPYLNTYIYNYDNDNKIFPLKSIRFGPALDTMRTKSTIELFLHKSSAVKKEIYINPNSITIEDAGYKLRN